MSLYGTILGVTVGVGSVYEKMAILAASCFTKHTGIPAIVLGDSQFAASKLPHPAALRLKLFEYVSAETVVYFDADWFCLSDWKPLVPTEPRPLLACRDFILKSESPDQHYEFESDNFHHTPNEGCREDFDLLRHDYINEIRSFAGITLSCWQWINSGLMILRREPHVDLLNTALRLYLGQVGHHPVYFEQPAIIKAIECTQLPVHFLPRKFNVLAKHESKWPPSVVGLHVKIRRHSVFVQKVESGVICSTASLEQHFLRPRASLGLEDGHRKIG